MIPLLSEQIRMVLWERRRVLGLTQREAAERMGVCQSYLCDLENGRRKSRVATIERWAEALQVRPRLSLDPIEQQPSD